MYTLLFLSYLNMFFTKHLSYCICIAVYCFIDLHSFIFSTMINIRLKPFVLE